MKKTLFLNLPSPPFMDVTRIWAGTYGTAVSNLRAKAGHDTSPRFPIPMLYGISAAIEKDVPFAFIDAQMESLDYDTLLKWIEAIEPEVIITQLALPSLLQDLNYLKRVKEEMDVTIVAIGAVCDTMTKEVLESGGVNYATHGLYPYYSNIKEILGRKTLFNCPGLSTYYEGKIIKGEPVTTYQIDGLELEAYKYIDPKKYLEMEPDENERYFTVLSAIGCPYGCYYCPYPINQGLRKIEKPVDEIISELLYLVKKGIDYIYFRDLVFGSNKKKTKKLLNEIIKKKINIKWVVESRVDVLDKELLELMKKAGCHKINFGIETMNEDLMKGQSKGAKVTKEMIFDMLSICRDVGIITQGHMIIGLPGDDFKSIWKTFKIMLDNGPDFFNWNIITPYPGTALHKMATKRKWISGNLKDYTSYRAVMRTDSLSKWQLNLLRILFTIYTKMMGK